MRGIAVFLAIGVLLLFAACGQAGKLPEEKAPAAEEKAPAQAPVEQKAAPAEEKPAEQAPQAQPALHAPDKCGSCHNAPTVDDFRMKHKTAFEKFAMHKDMCKECHNKDTCSKCHAAPDFIQ